MQQKVRTYDVESDLAEQNMPHIFYHFVPRPSSCHRHHLRCICQAIRIGHSDLFKPIQLDIWTDCWSLVLSLYLKYRLLTLSSVRIAEWSMVAS